MGLTREALLHPGVSLGVPGLKVGSTPANPQDLAGVFSSPPSPPPGARPPGAPHAHCWSINSAVMCFMNMQMAWLGQGEGFTLG